MAAEESTLGPRPRPFSAHPEDAIVAMVRRPFATSFWLGQMGLLFHVNRCIAVYDPIRRVIVHPANLNIRKLRHVARWRQELRCELHPDQEFYANLLALVASTATALDQLHFPVGGGNAVQR